jgi:hypothetical protein
MIVNLVDYSLFVQAMNKQVAEDLQRLVFPHDRLHMTYGELQ